MTSIKFRPQKKKIKGKKKSGKGGHKVVEQQTIDRNFEYEFEFLKSQVVE